MYALVVAPGGLKITPDAPDSCTVWVQGMPRGGSALVNGKPICGTMHQGMPADKFAQLRGGADIATVMAMPGPDHPLLVSVPLVDPVVTRKVGLIWRRGRSLSPAAQQLFDLFGEMKAGRKARQRD